MSSWLMPVFRSQVHDLAAEGDLEGLRASLDARQINAKDEYGFTLLHLAADRGMPVSSISAS
jgi:hypothetical protein